MDMSNKTLALFLLAAIVISLAGTLMSLQQLEKYKVVVSAPGAPIQTGYATNPGRVNLTVTPYVSCKVQSNITFGSGAASETASLYADTEGDNSGSTKFGSADCSSGTACQGMNVNNTGNTDATINVTVALTGANMLGTGGSFKYYGLNGTYTNTVQGCRVNATTGWGATSPITVSANAQTDEICKNLTHDVTGDMLHVEYNVTVPQQAAHGAKSNAITITCLSAE